MNYEKKTISHRKVTTMSKKLIILLSVIGAFALMALSGIGTYNSLVSKQESVNQAYSKIDASLQRRADLIPNVVSSVKGYMSHESEIFTKIADARAKIGSNNKDEKANGESELTSAISRLLVLQENYPELKADAQVSALMSELEGTENRIFIARKDYNEEATRYKSIRQFPRNIFANLFGFEPAELIKADETATKVPTVDLKN